MAIQCGGPPHAPAHAHSCQQGKIVAEWLSEEDYVCLLNESGAVTFRSSAETSIDITVTSVSIVHRLKWNVERENSCGSDHLPIFIEYQHSDVLHAFEPLLEPANKAKSLEIGWTQKTQYAF